jgi:hypothetical protein
VFRGSLVKESRTPDVICTLKGTSEVRVIVGAHYDKVTRSNGDAGKQVSATQATPQILHSPQTESRPSG